MCDVHWCISELGPGKTSNDGLNRKIMGLDGTMVKLADQARINRREFISEYKGSELDPEWIDRISKIKTRGWDTLFEKFNDCKPDIPTP